MEMINPRDKKLSLRKQCAVLNIPRSSLYYAPLPEKPENIKMMGIMDKHLLDHPTEGVISMVNLLRGTGYPVGPKRIRRLFKVMGYEAIYRRRNLTKNAVKEFIRPYLLRGLKITHANQVWCTDITYIPMAKGFLYMTAVIDVYSRRIMGWGISNSMTKKWCIGVLDDAIRTHGKPEIVNSDQGSQYTSFDWTNYLKKNGIKVSMDGKGRATDNAWIERFWKTIKYDYIYLNPCDNGFELYEGVRKHIDYYHQKKHQSIKMSPLERYEQSLNKKAA
jgi:putative transposase